MESFDGGLKQQFIVETETLADGSVSQTVVANRSSLTLKGLHWIFLSIFFYFKKYSNFFNATLKYFEGLKPNENYKVRIYSENKVGKSNASNTLTFKTKGNIQ